MSRRFLLPALLLLCSAPVCAQTGTAPVLATRPSAPYPEAARKANVSGEAVVAFSINAEGRTFNVHAVSGPAALAAALLDEIRGWRFVTPLPRDAEKVFLADYTYSIVEPGTQMAGSETAASTDDADVVPGPIAAVSGVVRSVDNRQTIDATPTVKGKVPAPGR